MKRAFALMAGVSVALAAGSAGAATLVQTLGTVVQVDGSAVVNGQTFASGAFTGSSDPLPFDVQNGLDGSGPNFSASWTFSYAGPAEPVNGGSLLFGLYDGDSAATGDQVALFTLNDIDLTAALNAALEATPGGQSQEVFYSLVLPSSVYDALASGSVTFALQLKGPGLGVLGETSFNGAILDFATLTVNSRDPQGPGNPGGGVPEPSSWALMIAGFGLAGASLRRRRPGLA